MDIAYISRFASVDIRNWSGTEYYIAKAIGEKVGNDLTSIVGLQEELNFATRLKYQINTKLGKKYHLNRSPHVVKQYAKQVELQLKNKSADIIFSPGTIPIAHLRCKQPKVFYTDATFVAMIDYYDWYKHLSSATIREGLELDQAAIDSSQLAIFASNWAADSAINSYGASPEKVKVVPFGANLDIEPAFEDIRESVIRRDTNICKIIFFGVDWERKGGDIVFNTVKELISVGLKCELHIIGLDQLPTEVESAPFVYKHGFISKATSNGLKTIESILKDCHFLFMPSKAEAYGLVYCEASAYGLPSIATKTGGITTIIKDDQNGFTFPLDTKPCVYADYIYQIFTNKKIYEELALSSYNEYRSRLNWEVAGRTINNYLKELL
ncbi:MAG: glycosyltransferase family 4 protein [Dysgonomonas sp.]